MPEFKNIDAAVNRLLNLRTIAEKAVRLLIRDLALETVDKLNDASGINMRVSDSMLIYRLSPDHFQRMPFGDICDEIASRHTEFGMGIYNINELPSEVNLSGINAHVHDRCKCTMTPVKAEMEEKSWKVIITDGGVEFVNESESIQKRIHGTAPSVKGGSVESAGTEPDNYIEPILAEFQVQLQASIEPLIRGLLER